MKFNEAIGIDVSKLTIDVAIHTVNKHHKFKNEKPGFSEMLIWVNKNTTVPVSARVFAFEHTGLYSIPLSVYLTEQKLMFIMIPGLELKKSQGIVRGKDDKIDASSIALYAYRRREEIRPYELPSKCLLELRHLLSLREKLVRQHSGFISTSKEIKGHLEKSEHLVYFEVHNNMKKLIGIEIRKVEKRLREIIKNSPKLYQQFKLITSIKGVGEQTAFFMITFTNGFTTFKNSRKFASYAGVAPFPYKSGTSIKGKDKVHYLANKKFKSLLSNCASIAIVRNTEMRIYYQNRLKQGKNKMSTLNIIRNKLLGRIFAVVNRGTPYVNNLKYAS